MQNLYTITEICHGSSDPVTPWVVAFKTSESAVFALSRETEVPNEEFASFDTQMDDSLATGFLHTFEAEDREYVLTKIEVR